MNSSEVAQAVIEAIGPRLEALHALARSERPTRLALSPAEAAEAIGVDRSTLYRWIDAGELSAARVGGRLIIRIAVLDEFLRDHERGGPLSLRRGGAA